MAIIEAKPVSGRTSDGLWSLSLRQSCEGWHGEKCFIVNTDDPDAAILAQNLPRYGTPWRVGRSLFRCYDVTVKYRCGTNDANEEAGGWCEVTCLFREPGDGRPLPFPGSAYSETGTRLTNVRQMYDIRRNPNAPPGTQGDYDLQIENGRGVTRELAFTTVTARIFPNNQSANAVLQRQARALDVVSRQVVNADQLVFPNIIGTGTNYIVEPGTARVHLQSHGQEAGYHFFDFEFLIGPAAAFWKWNAINADKAAFRQISSQQYDVETLNDLLAL